MEWILKNLPLLIFVFVVISIVRSTMRAREAALENKADTVTTLAPTGYVMLDGRRYEARSQSGLIARGATVRVVGVDSFHLIVSQL